MEQQEIKHYKKKERELNKQGDTVLGTLIEDGSLDVAEDLFKNGFKFTPKDRDLLLNCAWLNEAASVGFLVKYGFDPNHANEAGETALHVADSGEMARALIRAGASPNKQDCYGNTPLHTAYDGSLAAALLEGGADLTIRNQKDHTACEALKSWARADFGGDGYKVVQKSTEASEQRDDMLKSFTGASKPSDCKESSGPQQQAEPSQKQRRLM